jgi:hypothetical protein
MDAESTWPDDPADEVARIVASVPGVAGLSAGAFGDVKTYLPGRRVVGVRQGRGLTEVSIVLAWGASAPNTVRLIRSRVSAAVGGQVDVMVADVAGPDALPVTGEDS